MRLKEQWKPGFVVLISTILGATLLLTPEWYQTGGDIYNATLQVLAANIQPSSVLGLLLLIPLIIVFYQRFVYGFVLPFTLKKLYIIYFHRPIRWIVHRPTGTLFTASIVAAAIIWFTTEWQPIVLVTVFYATILLFREALHDKPFPKVIPDNESTAPITEHGDESNTQVREVNSRFNILNDGDAPIRHFKVYYQGFKPNGEPVTEMQQLQLTEEYVDPNDVTLGRMGQEASGPQFLGNRLLEEGTTVVLGEMAESELEDHYYVQVKVPIVRNIMFSANKIYRANLDLDDILDE